MAPSILKIVTAEDSPIIAERIQSLLSEIDYVEFLGNARNVSSAMYLIDQRKPNVVIVDIHLEEDHEGLNGIDLLIVLRKKYSEMKIIVFTNYNELHYRLACMEHGVNYFLDKSDDISKITETLKIIQSKIQS